MRITRKVDFACIEKLRRARRAYNSIMYVKRETRRFRLNGFTQKSENRAPGTSIKMLNKPLWRVFVRDDNIPVCVVLRRHNGHAVYTVTSQFVPSTNKTQLNVPLHARTHVYCINRCCDMNTCTACLKSSPTISVYSQYDRLIQTKGFA